MNYHVQFPGLGIHFDISPVAFHIGGHPVFWYGILIALGFVLAAAYALCNAKKLRIDPDGLMNCILVGIVCGIVGARLYYVAFYPGDMYRNDPSLIFRIDQGGLGIYGGIIGGLIGGAITAKLCKMSIPAVLDLASLGFLIGQGIGRWGNFINQEAFGTQTDLPWGMLSENTGGVTVHPCFLYESLWCAAGFALLHIFTRKWRRYDGQTFLLYLLWYGVGRFFIEGLRTDSLLLPGLTLRVSQVLAAVLVLACVVLLVLLRKRTKLTGCGAPQVVAMNAALQAARTQEPQTPQAGAENDAQGGDTDGKED